MKLDFESFIKGLGKNYIETVSKGTGQIDAICTDSRELKKGQFFWPIAGENFDGHKFIRDAVWAGCTGFVFSSELSEEEKTLVKNTSVFAVRVNDTLEALQKLARHVREMSKAKVITITGSNGKTTTKNLIAAVLSQAHKTVYSQKSFNNHIGVPLTILKIEKDTEFVVLELGMNHPGEIKKLMEIANPDIGLLLNVTSAHMGNFKSYEELVLAKGEIATCMKENGTVIFNHNLKNYAPFNESLRCRSREFGFENDTQWNHLKISRK